MAKIEDIISHCPRAYEGFGICDQVFLYKRKKKDF